ncbi:MAG: DUF2796 domain-containing protein [Thiothrix sp.]|uniref:DUF2796 domain-containing protein n=1 Tax=Thiothrix sp. TaxID=1032 RepID=UPI0026203649|nr:DUF2796 domain-containing protein [Thiothrix sp.]MDD5393497.1 DUF2796 domain-containing protein [Thiothrix sp.]
MKLPTILISTLSLLFTFSAGQLYADDQTQAAAAPVEHEEHGAHEHGTAKLSLSVGETGLEIMLDSPAVNLVGFEHMPDTDEDKQKLDDLVEKLEGGDELFNVNPEAECELKDTEVLSGLLGDDIGNAEAGTETAPTTAEPQNSDAHNDVDVTWAYACNKPAELKEVAVKLFSAFPEGFQRINAEWVTDKGASAVELGQDDTIKLTP